MRYMRKVRKDHGIRSIEVASLIGVSIRTYQSYEFGTRNPPIDTLEKLEDFFGVSYRDLLKVI